MTLHGRGNSRHKSNDTDDDDDELDCASYDSSTDAENSDICDEYQHDGFVVSDNESVKSNSDESFSWYTS